MSIKFMFLLNTSCTPYTCTIIIHVLTSIDNKTNVSAVAVTQTEPSNEGHDGWTLVQAGDVLKTNEGGKEPKPTSNDKHDTTNDLWSDGDNADEQPRVNHTSSSSKHTYIDQTPGRTQVERALEACSDDSSIDSFSLMVANGYDSMKEYDGSDKEGKEGNGKYERHD